MTDAASKAREIVAKWEDARFNNPGVDYTWALTGAIASAISAADAAAYSRALKDVALCSRCGTDHQDWLSMPMASHCRTCNEPMWQSTLSSSSPEHPQCASKAERERAGKLVDAAKAVFEPGMKSCEDVCCGCGFPDLFEAVKAYEVQP